MYKTPPEGYDFTKNSSFIQLLSQSKIDKNKLIQIINKTYYYQDYVYDNCEIDKINNFHPTYDKSHLTSVNDTIDFIINKGENSYFMINSIDEENDTIVVNYLTVPFNVNIRGITEYCTDRIRTYKINSIIKNF